MKLNEKKNKVPSTIITAYISNAWEQVGQLDADLDLINEYKDIAVIKECLESIKDAYLIAAGRLQNYLENKNELPKIDIEESKQQKNPSLKEDINIETVVITPPQPKNLEPVILPEVDIIAEQAQDLSSDDLFFPEIPAYDPTQDDALEYQKANDLLAQLNTKADFASAPPAYSQPNTINMPAQPRLQPQTPHHANAAFGGNTSVADLTSSYGETPTTVDSSDSSDRYEFPELPEADSGYDTDEYQKMMDMLSKVKL